MSVQQEKYFPNEFAVFPIPSDTQQPLRYTEVKSEVGISSVFLDTSIFYGSLISASTQPSPSLTQQALEKLRFFTNYSLDKSIEKWLISFNLLQDVYKVAQKVRSFFANRPITLRRNVNPDNHHLLEVWVETSDDLDLEIRVLNRFDNEYWIKQPEELRKKVIVLLK